MFERTVAFFKAMLSDPAFPDSPNSISTKRVISLAAFICLTAGFLVDLWTDRVVSQYVFEGMMWIVIAGFGFTGLEKFAPKVKEPKE